MKLIIREAVEELSVEVPTEVGRVVEWADGTEVWKSRSGCYNFAKYGRVYSYGHCVVVRFGAESASARQIAAKDTNAGVSLIGYDDWHRCKAIMWSSKHGVECEKTSNSSAD
jgi:hypothetical protein